MLVARDEQSCLVVSYKEIKLCIDSAFGFVFFSCYSLWPLTFFNRELSRGSSMSTTR